MGVRCASNVPVRKNKRMDFIARLIATMVGLWVTTLVVPSISLPSASTFETIIAFAVIAFLFTLVNSIIKPVVKTLAFPLYLVVGESAGRDCRRQDASFPPLPRHVRLVRPGDELASLRADGVAVHVAGNSYDDGRLLVVPGGRGHYVGGGLHRVGCPAR